MYKKRSSSKKSRARKSPVKKSRARKSPVKKSRARKSPVKKSRTRKSPVKKSRARKSPVKKSRARKSPSKCGKSMIMRKGYYRTSPSGKRTYVKPACIKDRGLPGKGKKIIPKLRKGMLTKYGYHSGETAAKRHTALKKAISAYDRNSVIRKLNAVYVLNRNTNPTVAEKFRSDQRWVSKNFPGKRKTPVKKSK